jgi:transglutaminase-like putative cysteine protease
LKLRVGYELQYEFPQPTPLIAMLNVHFSRVADLAAPDHIVISPSVPISCYRDGFGNWCSRILAPAGHVRLSTDAIVRPMQPMNTTRPQGPRGTKGNAALICRRAGGLREGIE